MYNICNILKICYNKRYTKPAPNKKILPNMWETTLGSVIAGEESLKATFREVKEEISIDLSPTNRKYLYYNSNTNN